jgi:hypothetical protein
MILSTIIDIATVAGPTVAGYVGLRIVDKKIEQPKQKAIAGPNLIDGRTRDEWYDLIEGMGKENFEQLSMPPLDGLERSTEVTWDVERLIGSYQYNALMRKWYPEQFCKYCFNRDCKQDCWEYKDYLAEQEEIKRDAERKRLKEQRRREQEAREEADRKMRAEEEAKRQAAYARALDRAMAEKGKPRDVTTKRDYSFDKEMKDLETSMAKIRKDLGEDRGITFVDVQVGGKPGVRVVYKGTAKTLSWSEIRSFQQYEGLTADGYVGFLTKQKMVARIMNRGSLDFLSPDTRKVTNQFTTYGMRGDTNWTIRKSNIGYDLYDVSAERNGITVSRTVTKSTYEYSLERVKDILLDMLDREERDNKSLTVDKQFTMWNDKYEYQYNNEKKKSRYLD